MAQRSYGLDVKILSPPHIVLALGLLALHIGALVMLAGAMNRSDGARRRTLEVLVLIVGGEHDRRADDAVHGEDGPPATCTSGRSI